MSLPKKKTIYGVKSVSFINKTTGLPYGMAEVVGAVSLGFTGETVELMGGANAMPWAVATGAINSEVSLTLREYPLFMYPVFYGASVTENAADADADVSTITNVKGTSVVEAATGIASVGVKAGSESDVKFTQYMVKALAGGTSADVYAISNIDFATGTSKEFEDRFLKITASPLTITTGAATEVPGFGIELTGGSGTIGMTEGDTASFETISVNTGGSIEVTVGASSTVYPEFGMVVYGQKESGVMFELTIERMKAVGAPINFTEKAFSEAEITGKAFYDSETDSVFKIRELTE